MMKKLNFGLIGYGYWGQNLARVIHENELCNLVAISDLNPGALNELDIKLNNVEIFNNYESILSLPYIDAVVVATPVSTHYNIVKSALIHGKHVLCEKILSNSVSEIEELDQLSWEKKVVLMVGHTFLFNSVVRHIKNAIEENDLGDILYITFKRTGLGPIRSDVDVIQDLASHDISILNYWFGKPDFVQCTNRKIIANKSDVAFIQAVYSTGLIADIQVSWLTPHKQRIIEVVGTRCMMIFDDVNIHERLKIVRTGKDYHSQINDFASFQLSIKDGDIIIPQLPYPEPLKEEIIHFADCILNGTANLSDASNAKTIANIINSIAEV